MASQTKIVFGLPNEAPPERSMVGVVRFKLTISCSQSKRLKPLGYTTTKVRDDPSGPRPTALTIGVTGLEPATSCSQSRRTSQLCYTPAVKAGGPNQTR